jgi:VanZ family protein
MLPLSYPGRWRLAGILLLLVVLGAAMAPAIWPDAGGPDWFITDKWMHGITFACLALWYSGQYARQSYAWLILGLLMFGGLIEIAQSMVAYRNAELADVSADLIGIVAGFSIALAGAGGWSQRVESWLQK